MNQEAGYTELVPVIKKRDLSSFFFCVIISSINMSSCDILEQFPMNMPSENPLTESTYFILLSLSPKPKHGYAIMKDVRELSESRVVLSTGTLYGALKRLLDQGWIERLEETDTKGNARDRKVYKLSQQGRRVLKDEIARLNKLLNAASQRVAREHP
jgi:DNA-binding PadR family transcriptional regulator